MSLSPGSGASTTSITASYSFLPQQQDQPQATKNGIPCPSPDKVTFSWDGHDLGGPVQIKSVGKPGQGQGYCVARLTFKPLGGLDTPGKPHVVQGAHDGGKDLAEAQFTITDTVAPAPAPPTQGASPTEAGSAPSTSARPSQPATQSSARPSASASTSAEPLPSEVPGSEGSPAIVGGAMKPPSGGSIGTIIAIVVGAITIACAGILFALVIRRRPDADEIPADAVTAEP
jgi:hypothetical protein